MNVVRIAFLFCLAWPATAQGPGDPEETWNWFATVPFKNTYVKDASAFYLVPKFSTAHRARHGQHVQLEGYLIPFDNDNRLVVMSRYPFSSCFFCGGAGPESVAELTWKGKPPRIKMDEYVRVEGVLKLNDSNYERLNFIIDEATIVPIKRR